MWFTKLAPGHIKFYFDGESVPRINMELTDFLSGQTSPFLFPMNGDDTVSSGGFYSYFPFAFRKSLKIALDNRPYYYSITYKTYADSERVLTYSGNENVESAMDFLSQPRGPWLPQEYLLTIEDSFSLDFNQEKLINFNTAATIYNLELKKTDQTGNPSFQNLADSLWLEMTWDQHGYHDVMAPFTMFFAGGVKDFACNAFPVTSDPVEKSFLSLFPMSFKSSAQIKIINKSKWNTGSFAVKIHYVPESLPGLDETAGYFRADYRAGLTEDAKDFIVLQKKATGHVVGCVLDMSGGTRPTHLEGDERIYIDGSRTPQLYGTGTEDFFNGGYYFNKGNFSLPYHGFTLGKTYYTLRHVCYRFFLTDHLGFNSDIRFGFEHGAENDSWAEYKSLIFWYGIEHSTLAATDSLNVGDVPDESMHAYETTGNASYRSKSHFYEGDEDEAYVYDNGRHLSGKSHFALKIRPDNGGVRLRRRLDYSLPHQKADVYIDDLYVGQWFDPGYNSSKQWRDSDFEIPASFTSGKTHLRITIDPSAYQSNWTEYTYWALTYDALELPSLIRIEQVQKIMGDGQQGIVHSFLPQPIVVRVYNSKNLPVHKYPVRFEIVSGGGAINTPADTVLDVLTDANGEAQVNWKLGARTSEPQKLRITVKYMGSQIIGSPAIFTATALADDPAQLHAMLSDTLSGIVDTPIETPLRVELADQWGNPVVDRRILFKIVSGSGLVNSADSTLVLSDSSGTALVIWRLGTKAGIMQSVCATCVDLPDTSIYFYARATAGLAHKVTAVGSTQLSGQVGMRLAQNLLVRVADRFDNPVSGQTVSFHLTAGDGHLEQQPGQNITDASGTAGCGLLLGPTAGRNSHEVLAEKPDLIGSPIVFVCSSLPARPHALFKISGDNQSSYPGDRLSKPFQVAVRDTFGNAISGHSVHFVVTQGGGTLDGQNNIIQNTDSTGLARAWLMMGKDLGLQQVQAGSQDESRLLLGSPCVFSATAVICPIDILLSSIQTSSPVQVGHHNKSIVTIILKNLKAEPFVGAEVTLVASKPYIQVTQPAQPTNTEGITVGYLSSVVPDAITVRALVSDTLAVADSASVVFVPEIPAEIVKVQGDSQTVMVGERIIQPILFRLTDAYDNPIRNFPFYLRADAAGDSPSDKVLGRTDDRGEAHFSDWHLSPKPGKHTLKVMVDSLVNLAAVYTAFAVLGKPAHIAYNSGNGQTGTVGTLLPQPFVASVTDSAGKGLLSIPVRFQIIEGDGQFESASVDSTDREGLARVYFRLGKTLAASVIQAGVEGLEDKVIFYCHSQPKKVRQVKVISGQGQKGRSGRPLPVPLTVQLLDEDNQPLSGYEVTFLVVSGEGRITEQQPVLSDSCGMATSRWVLGENGEQKVIVVTQYFTDVIYFNATLVANSPPQLLQWQPTDSSLTLEANQTITFQVRTHDPDNDSLFFSWWVSDELIEGRHTDTFLFTPPLEQEGIYRIKVMISDGLDYIVKVWQVQVTSDVNEIVRRPTTYYLSQNYPNPFNLSTVIRYDVPAGQHVSLIIYNTSGRPVRLLQDSWNIAGSYEFLWDGHSNSGQPLPSGIYYGRFTAGAYQKTIKLVMLR
ncbi:DUF2961 domain-containing protein [candidate division KSB1 bacterium]|nr:DUF2961 domain-containing protein [candidate division KSB1 bacterium]